jgi:hypothetical protein
MPKKKLPPDPEKMNARHAKTAHVALRNYRSGNDCETALGDLLTDLMHWSDRHDVDFDLALSRAHGHHEAETAAPPRRRSLQSAAKGR